MRTRHGLLLAGALGLFLCYGCSDTAAPATDAGGPDLAADATSDGASDAAADAASATAIVPLTVASYPSAAGKFLLVPVSVNGSAPVEVLLDTGSSGLRVFAAALAGTTVEKTSEVTSTQFGGEILAGHKASGKIQLGGVTTPKAIAFDLVESITCVPGDPYCDPKTVGQDLAAAGIQGIMGVGMRAEPSGIYNPLAQLGAPLSDGFTLRTGGFASKVGELVLGAPTLPGVSPIALTAAGTLPGGRTAWADDEIQVCFKVDGTPTSPPCTAAVLDSGSNLDVLYAKGLPASALTSDGFLASGVTFEASHGAALAHKFTVGTPITSSLDAVLVVEDDAFSILGIGVFFRHDVAFDLLKGRIGLRPR